MKEIVMASAEISKEGVENMVNVFLNAKGQIERRRGFTTFSQMILELWRINKSMKKHDAKTEIRFTLPLKGRVITTKVLEKLK